ncbi:hypothetical protein BDZ91DRAFT_731706 [Kalaharituber pfeilii]|nr:hypothetical protein BDZ91DRAFT_731706 [Kalaharituber pfeilii]
MAGCIPENYHIHTDWMNITCSPDYVTCKLVEDAIPSWDRKVDGYGLSLAEVPIDEISSVPLTLSVSHQSSNYIRS